MADFLMNIDEETDGFGPGGHLSNRNLISERHLDQLGEKTQKAVHGVQEIGSGVVDTISKLLVAMWTHSHNSQVGPVILAATNLTDVHLKKFKELSSDRNSITNMTNHAEEMFKRLKADVTALADVSTKSVSPDVWQKYLNQAQVIYRDLKRFHDTIVTATQDMQRAKPYLTNKMQQMFTVNDVIPVSNFCIFEQIDYEMQKQSAASDLRAMWTLFEYRFYIILLEFRGQLGRIDGDNMLVHIKPSSTLATSTSSTPGSLSTPSATTTVITENYSTTTQGAYDSIDPKILVGLEKSIGNLLTEFYTMCNRSISTLPANSIIRKFCPPFSQTDYSIKNVYTKNLQPDYTGSNIHTVIGPPRNSGVHAGAGEDSSIVEQQDIDRSFEMPNFNLHLLKGTGDDMYLERKPSFIGLGGSCCGGRSPLRRLFGERANGGILSGGDDPYVTYPDDDDDDYYDEDDADINIKISRPKKRFLKPAKHQPPAKVIKTLSANDKSSMEMRSKFVPLGAIVQLFSSISELLSQIRSTSYDEFYQNVLGIVNNFELIMSIETVLQRDGENQRPLAVTWQMMSETLMIYDHLIEKNDTVHPNTKTIYKDTVTNLKSALNIMDKDITDQIATKNSAGSNYEIYLPKEFRYTKNYGIIFQYWRLNLLIQQFVRALFTSESLFNNPNTGFSIGRMNRSSNGFEQDEEDRLVRYSPGATDSAANLAHFKNGLKLQRYADVAAAMQRQIDDIKAAVVEINAAFSTAYATYFPQDKKFGEFLKQVVQRSSCGALGSRYGPYKFQGEDGVDEFSNLGTEYYNVRDQPKYSSANLEEFIKIISPLDHDDILCFFSRAIEAAGSAFFQTCKELINIKKKFGPVHADFDSQDKVVARQADMDRLEALRASVAEYADRLNALNVEAFEKKFSTSIIPDNQSIVEAFVKSGYGEFLKQRFSMTLFFMGPSGSGKTYNQYGESSPVQVLGIDSRILNLPRISLSFRDYYGLSFYALDSFEAAVKKPVVYHYLLESVNDVLTVKNTKDEDKLKEDPVNITNFAGYKDKIDAIRKNNDLIRVTTANKGGSSRSFFITTVTQENNIKKNLVDTPGYEMLEYGSGFTNPFIFIHDYVVRIGSLVLLTGKTQNDYDSWKEQLQKDLNAELKKTNIVPSAESHTWFDNVMLTSVPLPSKVRSSPQQILEFGIQPCTFKEFINSSMLFVGEKFINNAGGEADLKTLANGADIKRDYKTGIKIMGGSTVMRRTGLEYTFPENGIPGKAGAKTELLIVVSPRDQQRGPNVPQQRATVPGTASDNPLLFTKQSKHNLTFDMKVSTYMAYTWAIYERLFVKSAESSTSVILEKFMPTFVPVVHRKAVRQSLETVFINQFNFWAQVATLKKGNESLINYLNPKAMPTVAIGDLFYEYLVLASDVVFTHSGALDMYNRYLYASNNWAITLDDNSLSIAGIAAIYKEYKWDLGMALIMYDTASLLYNPYVPLGDLSAFNSFIHAGKNLFVTIVNGEKAKDYFSFMDVNRTKLPTLPAAATPATPQQQNVQNTQSTRPQTRLQTQLNQNQP